MTYRNPALLRTARGAPCTGRWEGCDGGGYTSVWAHSQRQADGHGMGHKSADHAGAILCHACHDLVDGRRGSLNRETRDEMMLVARVRTWAYLWESGRVKVA